MGGTVQPTTRQHDKWWLIEQIVAGFIAANPRAWAAFQAELSAIRATRADQKFAASTDKNSANRWTASFPTGENGVNLLDALLKFVPELLKEKKTWAEFLRRYPAFKVPEKY